MSILAEYERLITSRKAWSNIYDATRTTRYRHWISRVYIGTKPTSNLLFNFYDEGIDRYSVSARHPALSKHLLTIVRKEWKIGNTRTAYLYWRDFK